MPRRRERESTVTVRLAAEIPLATVGWLIPERIPRGSLTMVVGRDGSAKTTFARWLATAASRGGLTGEPIHVHLALAEDDAARVTAPALVAAGADLGRIEIVTGGLWRLPNDLERLDAHLLANPSGLVVIDPLAASVRALGHQSAGESLRGLRELAERHDTAVVVVHHIIKRAPDAASAIAGGYNVRAACRSILFWEQLPPVGCHYVRTRAEAQGVDLEEQTGRLCLLWGLKASYTKLACPLVFEQRSAPHPRAPGVTVGTVELLALLSEDLDSGMALDGSEGSSRCDRAKAAILVLLARGPLTADELEGAVLSVTGASARTFQRARAELADEGTIERFQAPRHDPDDPRDEAPRCHWWRLAVPDHAPWS
jgi:hypothetical protein